MTSSDIRQSFLDFFASKAHRIVPSAPVVPHDDPTLLFTNAGMNQFKDVFLGTGTREYTRAADTQKCIRVSGKHNDLEEVGRDTYHHTFFEMLGNWSFGDYYKREAISWAWELLTDVWKLPKERLHATVYRDDDEAFALWAEVTDIDPAHVHRFGEKDNFWEMGETGPCGPCSEIHVDLTDDLSGAALVNAGSPLVMEIWNLVFIQYNRDEQGVLHELPAKHVDTGMGFERICAVLQGARSNYDTDIFMPVIARIAALTGRAYDGDAAVAMRVIADHVRMLSFAIADGAMPGNEGRGYVLRRILRRASRFARSLEMREPFLWRVVGTLCDTMGTVFPELVERRDIVEKVIRSEEESFNATLDRGLEIFDEIVRKLTASGGTALAGDDAFKLYDTFGFPIDLTMLLSEERGLTVDIPRFDALLREQKERSRAVTKSTVVFPTGRDGAGIDLELAPADASRARFVGYETLETDAEVLGVKLQDGSAYIVLDQSPFYVESGGQVSDTGVLRIGDADCAVIGLTKSDRGIIHVVQADDGFRLDTSDRVRARVDGPRRRAIMRNHTATHLMHAALRAVLGTHVQQAGSLVDPERLRFDFSHFSKVQPEEVREIEAIVNEHILAAQPVAQHRDIAFDDAKKMGALMFFGDKYGDRVNVLEVPGFSMEFCGGTHVRNTAEIGLFKIVSEGSIASGTRRIEAVTGQGVLREIDGLHDALRRKDADAEGLHDRIRQLEKELSRFALQQAAGALDALITAAPDWEGAKIIVTRVTAGDAEQLRALGELLRGKLGSGVGVLAAVIDDKVALVCVATDDVIRDRGVKAGAVVSELARRLGGKGGGRPQIATAGGKDIAMLDEVLAQARDIITAPAS
ncbi:MAG: alanine--tRNA ligase [Ignavibacteria bacterium]|nr:alanine--tRNA ligase [Ignavibacteria bacterium]